MIKDILTVVVYCHRAADGKEFTERLICVPPERAKYLEKELNNRLLTEELLTVQLGRVYIQPTPFTPYLDETDSFLARVDEVKLHPSKLDRAVEILQNLPEKKMQEISDWLDTLDKQAPVAQPE